ncbi:MAG: hypothetical protein BGO29_10780 [Bacteroidales bacterium 36-12]|nr:MAG: hypothetical protein BGO29_10780 [Bacteroidales bacterium 36-12]
MNSSKNGVTILSFFTIVVFSWMIFSSLQTGYKILHPYILYLFMILGYILWAIFIEFFGLSKFRSELWIIDNFFNTDTMKTKVILLIIYFLLFTHLGALTHKAIYPNVSFSEKTPNINHNLLISIQKQSRILFFIFIPYFLIYTLSYVMAVLKDGYIVLYDPDNFFKVPIWLSLADDIVRTLFWMYIATKPNFKDAKKIITIYFIILIISLGMGTRGIIFGEMIGIIAIFSYLGYTFPFKKIVGFGIVILLISPIIEDFRQKETVVFEDNFIKSAITSQGLPIYSLGATLEYENILPDPKQKYLIGPLVEFFNNVKQTENEITGIKDIPRLPQVISFYVSESSFFSGWGIGNTIIAEFYIFGGYWALAFLSFLYTFLLVSFFDRYRNFTLIFISLISLRIIFFTVRENPMYIIVQLFLPIIIYIILRLYFRRIVDISTR